MAREATQQEIEMAMQKAEAAGLSLDWEQCSFRYTNGQNIMCFYNGIDYFYVSKKGKFIRTPLSMAKSIDIAGLSKQQIEQKLKSQFPAKVKKVFEKFPEGQRPFQIKKVVGCVDYGKKKNAEISLLFDADLIYAGRKVGEVKRFPLVINKYEEDDIYDYLSKFQRGDLDCPIRLSSHDEMKVHRVLTDYIVSCNFLDIDKRYLPFLNKSGLFLLYSNNDPGKIKGQCHSITWKKGGNLLLSCAGSNFYYSLKNDSISKASFGGQKEVADYVQKHKTILNNYVAFIEQFQADHKDRLFPAQMTIYKDRVRVKLCFSDNIKRELELSETSNPKMTPQAIKKWCASIEKEIAAAQEVRRKKLETNIKSLPFAGDFLAYHIAEFVSKNEKYITAAAAVKNLRGQTQSFSGSIEDTEASGKYAMVPLDDVDKKVKDLIRYDIFSEREYKGTFGRFNTVKLTAFGRDFLDSFPLFSSHGTSFSDFSDAEWREWMEKVRREGKERKLTKAQVQEQMGLLEHPNVVILYPDLVKEFVAKKPEEWKLYVDTMYAMETGIKKKYWKLVKGLFV